MPTLLLMRVYRTLYSSVAGQQWDVYIVNEVRAMLSAVGEHRG
jgi:hypothetical protein